MASAGAVLFAGSSLIATAGSSVSTAITWQGGRTVFILNGLTFASQLDFQMQGPSGAWLKINAATINADTAVNYDLPAGQYRLASGVGSSVAIFARLVNIPYY